ncbi:DNA gyrase subunit A [Miniphocaeibacter halophilus]|uniref:DNA gyrase subunit A n=1 Tax=Miniphocaeibacter halophilus TaxID=2931922 RepID=A0AC61MTE7_9FIRM|nr:DNA gyrase subunit A [Miniphocaeibacter halophilus]QQK08907.1 DNA gyrase subunit A [Miniphocaeibacter halophilus]
MSDEILEHSNILDADIKKEMKESYLDYSMSVIVSRALPDVRDGLKPVHRRIIYGMQEQGLFPDRGFSKSARLVGDVMGKFHPHGDTAIYDAVVRLAQDFNMRYPLVQGQGNFGSIDGDGAAAPRYTELRMAKLCLEMLRDINKNTVDFEPNYDGREKEPVVLPSRFPNLLVNGSSGIAVGMATNMAPHNLNEVIDGINEYIDNRDITIEELSQIIKGPDFPTGAHIMGKEGIKNAYNTGRGKVILRAVAEIVEHKNRERIIVTEIPYQVNKSNLIIKIAELVKEKRIEGISDLRDESGRKGLRIVIELKRDANAQIVLNNLYKYTQMQVTFGIINLALVKGVPKVLNLKELISYYVEHQEEVVTRRTQFDLDKAEARAHIVEGLLKAIDNIDEIIHIIRTSYSDALEKLMDRFEFSEIQAQAILDMRLRRLQGLEREKLQEEYNELIKEIARLKEILANEDLLLNIIKTELTEIKEKFGDKRRTKIKPAYNEINLEELIEEEDVLITITKHGYVKRIPADSYKVQNRGGKGVIGLNLKDEDFVETLFITSTHSTILFFTNKGRVYSLRAYEIPEGKRQARGQAIINLLQISKDEKVQAAIPFDSFDNKSYLFMATKYGLVKKVRLDLFKNLRKSGLIALTLKKDDELIAVRSVLKEAQAMMVTKNGLSIRFKVDNIRPIGRSAQGVRGIRLNEDDFVVAMDIIDDNKYLLVVSENGYGKKTNIDKYKVQNRGGKGVKTYKISKRTGDLISARLVNLEDEIILMSAKGDIIRLSVKQVSTKGRDTMGVKIRDVQSEDDKIVAVTKYIEDIED